MDSLRPKISIIGAGSVGSSFAFSLLMKGTVREVALIDKDIKKAQGECMDLNHGLSFCRPVKIYAAAFDGCRDSDIVAITAGAKQKPGQSRIELLQANIEILKEIIPQIIRYSPQAVILMVTNPVDILTYAALKISGLPSSRVIGSGTVLDSSRLRYLMSVHCQVDARNVHAYIIGEHGDSELAVWSNASIGGMILEKYCPFCIHKAACRREQELEEIFQQVKNAAYKIIEAKGATFYAIALSLVRICEAIVRDENAVLPVSTLINDYCGINDVCLSLPAIVNGKGVERVLHLELSDKEKLQFKNSAAALKQAIKKINF
ncbi:MAG: L-lactate dehydrogenase [Candidatus Omnitrophica bacterium]|nr:L-lactate dehydrogenase [Candidatus Omnitrophota bacterium]MDD5430059.1 L-lactate dehydrogenase [Candidatus Omnitrophota bacterium]